METIISWLRAVLGEYEPIYSTYSVDPDTTIQVVASGAAGVNWEYVGALVLLGLTIFSVFRLIGLCMNKLR